MITIQSVSRKTAGNYTQRPFLLFIFLYLFFNGSSPAEYKYTIKLEML